MTTVNKYRISCTTEGGYVYAWGETPPTTCPTNTSHSIDTGLTTIVDTATQNIVSIKEETIATQGYWRCKGYTQSINATAASVTSFNISWPYRTSMLEGWFFATVANAGDIVSAKIGPLTIGAIGAPVSVSDVTITVSNTVMQNAALGFEIALFDGVNMTNLGEIIGINTTSSTITCVNGSGYAYSPLTPTYVLLTIHMINNMVLDGVGKYTFASKKVGGKTVPPNVPVTISYTNTAGGAKTFNYSIEQLY